MLKHRTAATHERVEESLALVDGELTTARLRAVLGRFAGFWPGIETRIEHWALGAPDVAADLDWPRRRRGETLRRDLRGLGMTTRELLQLPAAPDVFDEMTTADVLGWLYVSEGSTLGGAVIDRAWRTVPGAVELRTFTPYVEGPGPMWRAYQRRVHDWVGDDPAREEAVVAAAVTSFAALERWLAPIAVRSVA